MSGKSAATGSPPGQAPSQPPQSPFALSADEWHHLGALANVPGQVRTACRTIGPQAASLQNLFAAWRVLDGQIDHWGVVRAGLKQLAADISSYAAGVATGAGPYGKIQAILIEMQGGSAKPEFVGSLRALLTQALAEVNVRADSAVRLAQAVVPFTDAAFHFIDQFNHEQRNPPTRVLLDDLPGLCLSVDGGGSAISGDVTNAGDHAQLWTVVPSGPGGPYAFRTADQSQTLVVDHVAGMEAPLGGFSPLEIFIKEGPRPHLAPTQQYQDAPQSLFYLTAERYLQPAQWLLHTLDCSGNDSWGQGTAVLCWTKNDGRNQKWKVQGRSVFDLKFYDACAAIASQSAGVQSFQHLEGDWRAIGDDLTAGLSDAIRHIDNNIPFVANLQIGMVIDSWQRLAAEAQLAVQGL